MRVSNTAHNHRQLFKPVIVLTLLFFLLPGLACSLDTSKNQKTATPNLNDPPVYVAEVENVLDVWIPVNAAGNYDEEDRVMGVEAKMHYELTFPRDGGPATIEKVYAPYKVDGVIDEARFTDSEVKAMLSRTDFPISREIAYQLTYHANSNDYAYGYFDGKNRNAGADSADIIGVVRAEYADKGKDIQVDFYIDFDVFSQTYHIVQPSVPTWGK